MSTQLRNILNLAAGCLLALSIGRAQKPEAECAEVQRQMEAVAKSCSHFATADLISNRPTDSRWPAGLMAEQAQLRKQLEDWASHAACLPALLEHAEPKVRTLALGALLRPGDPHDLPLVAAMAGDAAATFPEIHDSMSSAGGVRPMSELESPQSVGEIARRMLVPYLKGAGFKRFAFTRSAGGEPDAALAAKIFAQYWKPRAGRETCASWFLVRLQRATRHTEPLQKQYRADIERVLADVRALPAAERAWTQLYLRCVTFTGLSDDALVADLKAVGPAQVIRFLQRVRVMNDPDLWFDDRPETDPTFSWMCHFVLRHGRELLRPEDAPKLLVCEEGWRGSLQGTSPAWAAAAAELLHPSDEAGALTVIDGALQRFPLEGIGGGREQAVLMGALWRMEGGKRKAKIGDWFYRALEKVKNAKSDESNHGPVDFVRLVQAAARPDTGDLLSALVADPRFSGTDWPTLKELLSLAREGREKPLATREEIYRVYRRPDAEKTLAQWRTLLRREYPEAEAP